MNHWSGRDRKTVNQWVVGSIPTFGVIFIKEAL
jgi:hypothetical protein